MPPAPRRAWPPKGLVLAAVLLLTGTLFTVQYLSRSTLSSQPLTPDTQSLPLPDKPSIVVLPFQNLSGDPGQDYFSDGLTDVLTGHLSRLSRLFVIARNSAFTYKGKAVKVQDVSKELGVRYVLQGSVHRADQRVRITAQLIDATTGFHLWSEQYERPLQDFFALQDEIVQKIVTTLQLQLALREQGLLVRKATTNLEAYDYYLRGMQSADRYTKEPNAQARQMFERASALDPGYAEAYAQLGWTYYGDWSFRWSQDPQALGQKALALDESVSTAHELVGTVYARKQQYEQAIAEGERAVALSPNNAESYAGQATVFNWAGRHAEALRAIQQAIRLNPLYPAWYLVQLGWAYRGMGQYAEAIVTYKHFFARNPDFLWGYPSLAGSYLVQWASQLNQDPQTLELALAAAQRALTLNDAFSPGHKILGAVYLWQKQYEHALAEMERAMALDPTEANGYANLAVVLSCMGRTGDALEAAAQALRLKPTFVDDHLPGVGSVYAAAGRPEDAIVLLKQYLVRYPNFLGGHLTLAAAYSELGKDAEARTEAAEVLRLNPQFSLEVHKEGAPIKDLAILERQLAALRKAGLK